jgi:hypothetical protein
VRDPDPGNKTAAALQRRRDARSSVEERPPEYDSDKYFAHLLDQYKLYVEMADRMSTRKMLVMNTFMTIMGAAAVAYASAPNYFGKEFVLFFQLGITAVSFLIALMWRSFMIHHSKVSDTKFKVIHEIEQLLPAQPYRMEYEYCVKERKTSSALSRIDRYLPLIAAALSAAGFVYAIIAHITP